MYLSPLQPQSLTEHQCIISQPKYLNPKYSSCYTEKALVHNGCIPAWPLQTLISFRGRRKKKNKKQPATHRASLLIISIIIYKSNAKIYRYIILIEIFICSSILTQQQSVFFYCLAMDWFLALDPYPLANTITCSALINKGHICLMCTGKGSF